MSTCLIAVHTPIAEWVLDKAPSLYNPLHSTFNSRVTSVDGGYYIKTPVVYIGKDGYVRKILATSNDAQGLMESYESYTQDNQWFANQLDALTEEATYISVPAEQRIIKKAEKYTLGEPILFGEEENTASRYVAVGLNRAEAWGAWSQGNETVFHFTTDSDAELLNTNIQCGIYRHTQRVIICVNDTEVYRNDSYKGEGITFNFRNPGPGKLIELRINMPSAISLSKLGYADSRIIALGFSEMVIKGGTTQTDAVEETQ